MALPHEGRKFGAIPSLLGYANPNFRTLASVAAPRVALPAAVTWQIGDILDQGDTGECVGHGGAAWEASLPVADPGVSHASAETLYCACRARDGDAACDKNAGTSLQSLADVLRELGRVSSYAWEDNRTDAALSSTRDFILGTGTAILACEWYASMDIPFAGSAIMSCDGVTTFRGWHCTLLYGYTGDSDYFRLQNSWGAGWGNRGVALLPRAELAKIQWQVLAAPELPGDWPEPQPEPQPGGCLPGGKLAAKLKRRK